MLPESNVLSFAVAVCGKKSLFTQVTRSPRCTFSSAGLNCRFLDRDRVAAGRRARTGARPDRPEPQETSNYWREDKQRSHVTSTADFPSVGGGRKLHRSGGP